MLLDTIHGLSNESVYEITMSGDGHGATVAGVVQEGGMSLSEGDVSFGDPRVMSQVGAAMVKAAARWEELRE